MRPRRYQRRVRKAYALLNRLLGKRGPNRLAPEAAEQRFNDNLWVMARFTETLSGKGVTVQHLHGYRFFIYPRVIYADYSGCTDEHVEFTSLEAVVAYLRMTKGDCL